MKRSESIAELSKALTNFQKSAPKIGKDKTAEVPMKNGGKYSYKYADLATIWDSVRGFLADNNLSIIQSPSNTYNGTEQSLTTVVAHSSGELIEDTMKLTIVQDTPQGQGSAITYARRYMLCAMLGIVADSDTDAQDHRTATPVQKKLIFDTARKVMPELGEDPLAMVNFLAQVVGKHPNRILESEVDDVIQAIESYTAEQIKE